MKIDDRIFVFDDIIEKDYQNKIKDLLLNNTFPWFFCKDVSIDNNDKQQRPGFQHYFAIDKKVTSKFHNDIIPLITKSLNKINYKHTEILQGRSFLQLPLNISDRHIVDTPHVDADIDHLVVLYYVNDNEANTIIYENEFKGYDNIPHNNDLKIKQKISPKMGRVVVFNGKYWHTAEQPEHNNRCIINYNVI
tara:strand:+ start:121 stop:696 length:576 start_codon:yes stop_codon:yes gene_type:complete